MQKIDRPDGHFFTDRSGGLAEPPDALLHRQERLYRRACDDVGAVLIRIVQVQPPPGAFALRLTARMVVLVLALQQISVPEPIARMRRFPEMRGLHVEGHQDARPAHASAGVRPSVDVHDALPLHR